MGTRAVVVHPRLKAEEETGDAVRDPEARLDEAVGLSTAIDLLSVHAEVVTVSRPRPGSLLGSGQVERLAQLVEALEVEVVVIDRPLTPVQQRNLERALKAKVLDRTQLILEIFGARARTHEGRLQVDLASLTFQRSRLVRSWTHLERQRGGTGFMGGPGESQLEIDRRLIGDRIIRIRRELEEVKRTRELHRGARRRVPYPVVALVGYTNAGKSTLMNRLTEAGVLAENKLFSTLDTRTRPWRLPGGRTVLLSDTVGFIRNLPTELVASFHATLEEALNADVLFVVVDASAADALDQLDTVDQILDDLGASTIPRILVLNKVDAVADHSELARLYARDRHAVAVSAATGQGLDELEARLQANLASSERRVEILVPHSAGRLHAEIRQGTTVLSEFFTDEGCLMECLVSPALLGRILAQGAALHDRKDAK